MRGRMASWMDDWCVIPWRFNRFRLEAVLLLDRRTRKFLKAYLGWGICQVAEVNGMTGHPLEGIHLRGYTVSTAGLRYYSWQT